MVSTATEQYALGYNYQVGLGVAKDEKVAVEWYGKSAAQGNADAQDMMVSTATEQYALGYNYQFGLGVPKDEKVAVEWYGTSAAQGYADAQYNLGLCYENGWGVTKDEKVAVDWYGNSAAQGNAGAQWKLGLCYQNGCGVAKDEKVAADWYGKSAAQGYAGAQHKLVSTTEEIKAFTGGVSSVTVLVRDVDGEGEWWDVEKDFRSAVNNQLDDYNSKRIRSDLAPITFALLKVEKVAPCRYPPCTLQKHVLSFFFYLFIFQGVEPDTGGAVRTCGDARTC